MLDLSNEQLVDLLNARARRHFKHRGLRRKHLSLIKKLRAAVSFGWKINLKYFKKRAAPTGEKPAVVKTHLRDMIVVPEMIGSVVGVYNGKTFNSVEIKVLFKTVFLVTCTA